VEREGRKEQVQEVEKGEGDQGGKARGEVSKGVHMQSSAIPAGTNQLGLTQTMKSW
jgi:hypothetical protein